MNKSDDSTNKGTIFLMDDIEVAKKKIMSAKTDSFNKVHFDEENQPGISNLINIYASLTGKDIAEIEAEFQALSKEKRTIEDIHTLTGKRKKL